MEKDNNLLKYSRENKISRKEAINKVGKYAAFTATTMMLLMSPVDSSAKINSNGKPVIQAPKKPKKH
ncbi:MAG TPA: hypothetical protein DCR40_02295 [Prolixibacteraceae bacterium]|nr:hypothetical protein [Prolixibacteraceae bacterium]